MKIFIEKTNTNKTLTIKKKQTLLEILKQLKINPETVIVSKNNKLITKEQEIKDTDEIQILSIISGG